MNAKENRILSVFIDESGNFGDPNDPARFCIITLVFHNQTKDISRFIDELNQANFDLGLDPATFQFHTAPLIRQDGPFAAMHRKMRGRIFDRMMTFVRKADFNYSCFSIDTNFINSTEQICTRITMQIAGFIADHEELFTNISAVKIYYDAGQKQVGQILVNGFRKTFGVPVVFAQGAKQSDYKLLQVADLICSIHLIELRLKEGLPMNTPELRFFGGVRDFKRRILKTIKVKEIS